MTNNNLLDRKNFEFINLLWGNLFFIWTFKVNFLVEQCVCMFVYLRICFCLRYVCECWCIYFYVHVYGCVCVFVPLFGYIFVCIWCMCVCVCVNMWACVCMFLFLNVCLWVCIWSRSVFIMWIYICICVFVCIPVHVLMCVRSTFFFRSLANNFGKNLYIYNIHRQQHINRLSRIHTATKKIIQKVRGKWQHRKKTSRVYVCTWSKNILIEQYFYLKISCVRNIFFVGKIFFVLLQHFWTKNVFPQIIFIRNSFWLKYFSSKNLRIFNIQIFEKNFW